MVHTGVEAEAADICRLLRQSVASAYKKAHPLPAAAMQEVREVPAPAPAQVNRVLATITRPVSIVIPAVGYDEEPEPEPEKSTAQLVSTRPTEPPVLPPKSWQPAAAAADTLVPRGPAESASRADTARPQPSQTLPKTVAAPSATVTSPTVAEPESAPMTPERTAKLVQEYMVRLRTTLEETEIREFVHLLRAYRQVRKKNKL